MVLLVGLATAGVVNIRQVMGVIIGTAIGAAMSGLRPVAEMMTVNFIMVAMDQVVNAAAHIRYMFGGGTKVPLVIRTPGGGGHQLGAQHSHSHENWFATCPVSRSSRRAPRPTPKGCSSPPSATTIR